LSVSAFADKPVLSAITGISFLIERFDRKLDARGRLLRLPQEEWRS
jgi:hypothetical protein